MNAKRSTALAGSCLASAAILDLVRLGLQVIGLRRLRDRNPEMFDGRRACEAIDVCIRDYQEDPS